MGINKAHIKQLLMRNDTTDTKIDLSNQGLLDSDIEELVELLKQHSDKKIKFLNLYGNNITDKGAAKLAELKNIIELNLNKNPIHPNNVEKINEKIKKNAVTVIPSIEETSAKGIRFTSSPPKQSTQANEIYLDQYSETKPFTILLAGENLSDGIGDFVHLSDFYKYLKEKYKNEKRIKIQCVSFIDDEKLNIINKIYGENFKITETQAMADKSQSDIIFLRRKDDKAEHEFSEKNKDIDLLFFVSTRFGQLRTIKPKSSIYLSEYENTTIHAPVPCDSIENDLWTFKRNMGIASDRAGIKIIKPIINARKVLEGKNAQTPNYENPYLLNLSVKKEDTFLAAGYLQSRIQSDLFIMNSLALAGNKSTINIVINHEGVDKNSNGLFSHDKLNHYIESFNLSRIEVVTATGEILFEKDIENADSKKVLRIVQFKNISEHDKYLLYASADSVGASGDTSCSELISSTAFPYIAKKQEFLGQLINQASELKLSTLHDYLKLLNEMIDLERNEYFKECLKDKDFGRLENELLKIYENNKVQPFIVANHEEIQSQWRILCTWIIENKDVFNFTDQLIDRAIKHSSDQLQSDYAKTIGIR